MPSKIRLWARLSLLFMAILALDHGLHLHMLLSPVAKADSHLYTCGMHPQVIQQGPGSCPICGMDLTPLQEKGSGTDGSQGISIDPIIVQNMGLRVGSAQSTPIWRHIRAMGTVLPPENTQSVVNLRFSGWIETLYVDKEGQKVAKGDILFTLYSPEVESSQAEFLLALRNYGPDHPMSQSARLKLKSLGLSTYHINQVAKNKDAHRRVRVTAPQDGYLSHSTLLKGARVETGKDLMTFTNLETVWVEAEIYEFDAPYIFAGQKATIEWNHLPGQPFKSQVDYVYPTLNPHTRTLRVRLIFDNPGMHLRPGMSAIVRLRAQYQADALTIPSEAIIHSGERQLVFIAHELGRYSPQTIQSGLVGDNGRTHILDGLEAGETVVTSGQFLLDSESQLQEAMQKMLHKGLHGHGDSGENSKDDGAAHGNIKGKALDEPSLLPLPTYESAQDWPPPAFMGEAEHGAEHRRNGAGGSPKSPTQKTTRSASGGGQKSTTKAPGTQAPKITHFRCPLHPKQIQKKTPGSCPIDGLPLEGHRGEMLK